MPVSPVVQQHQESIVQQSTTPEQLSYNKEFGEVAYKLLNSKYPRLAPFTITFKILEGGGQESKDYGVGSFIIARGDGISYIPVVLQGGSIVSCEMVYDKEEESFRPLSAKEVKAIVNENRIKDHTTVQAPRTEDTKQVFQNMFRPPTSSNPVLASSRLGLDVLPAEAKTAIAKHLQDNPGVFAKVATFYDTQVLASRLACPAGMSKQAARADQADPAEDYAYMDKVIKLDELTEKTAEAVQAEYPGIVDDLINQGYAIVNTEVSVEAIPSDQFSSEIETSFNAFEASKGTPPGTANILKVTDDGYIKQIRCLVTEDQVLHPEFSVRMGYEPVVLSDYKEGLTRDDIYSVFGCENTTNPPNLACVGNDLSGADSYTVLVPGKGDSFKSPGHRTYIYPEATFTQVDALSGAYVVTVSENGRRQMTFTSDIQRGSLSKSDSPGAEIMPLCSILVKVSAKGGAHRDCIRTLAELRRILERTSIKLQYHPDGPDHNLTNRTLDKTAQFKSEADMIRHAVAQYNMDKTASAALLKHKKIHLIKTANAMDQAQARAQSMAGPNGGQPIPMGSSEQPSPGMWNDSPGYERKEEPLVVDESLLEDVAEMGNEDLMDTGMIASLAGNDDIKALLVDFTEDFEGTVTELAKAVLIMVVNQEEFKEQYGREEYNSILNKLRSVFTGLGDIVFDLDEYVNNQSFNEGL